MTDIQVKKNLEEAEKAGGREVNKKNVVQKVRFPSSSYDW
jgi:hypothetical protein